MVVAFVSLALIGFNGDIHTFNHLVPWSLFNYLAT